MNMKDIVTSLEISEKLLTLGVKQNSLFHWIEFEKEKKIYRTVWEARELDNVIASAFTVEEIFELLPREFFKDETRKLMSHTGEGIEEQEHVIKHRYHFKFGHIGYADVKWYCWAIGHGYDNFGLMISENSFGKHDMVAANAAAKMLIYLLENGLIKNEEK